MTEIELKAHVEDPNATEAYIRSFAQFVGEYNKHDVYWQTQLLVSPKEKNEFSKLKALGIIGAVLGGLGLFAALLAVLGAEKDLILGLGLVASALAGIGTLVGARGQPKPPKQKSLKVRLREEKGLTLVSYKHKEIQKNIEINQEHEFTVSDRSAFESLLQSMQFTVSNSKEKHTKTFFLARGGFNLTIELSLVVDLGWFIEIEILQENPDPKTIEKAKEMLKETLNLCNIDESCIEPRYYTDLLAEKKNHDSFAF